MIRYFLPLLALAACSPVPRPDTAGSKPVAIEADSIRYATAPCFGTCPVYSVTVRPDGVGTFVGTQHTAVIGERSFRLSRAQYDALAAKLAPYRPESGERRISHGSPDCGNAPTDMPSAEVTWTRAIGDSMSLYFYYGCAANNQALSAALRDAPAMLPIGAFIGKR
ncbi:DUF6438 domain-containing protein [Sphingomonas sp. RS2018]